MGRARLSHTQGPLALTGPSNREGAPETALALARAIVWRSRGRLLAGLAILALDRAASFALPLAPKVLIDEVVQRRRPELLPMVAALVLGGAAIQAACAVALTRVLGLSAERVVLGWRRALMARVTRARLADVGKVPSGALVSRILDDAATMQNLVGAELVRWSTNVLTALAAFVALLAIDWRMTLVALGVAAVPGLSIHLAYRRLSPLFRRRGELRAEVTGRLAQTLSGLRVVKAFGAERREARAFARGMHALFRVTTAATARRAGMHAGAILAAAGVIAVVIVMGGRAMIDGALTLGDFGSYVAFAVMFSAPVLDLPEIAARTSETLADLERLREIAELAREDEGGGSTDPAPGGDVRIEDVRFEYEPGRPALDGVSFVAEEGKTTAIVGPSGAGKSTLFALLLRFHAPTGGRVTIGDRDVGEVSLAAHRRRVAVVLQDDFLFDGTLADNVALGRPRASREAIARALSAAQCDDFVAGLPDGLDTLLGERGARLSGGQRQRVSIARAILADAPVLLLDEATSSLDGASEERVRAALAELRRGRTVIVIAHRLSTVRSADRIVVLERGRVVEQGSHDELRARGGRYADLWRLQTGDPPVAPDK